eukprot:TRINITY_DN22123_c0_g1_i1.p1 TRINITY_DN22123_c0_g1~~TRINITY_DN22123_c0_g1_i1.p1  ORF type:complete len:106 (+),score=34.58 TRINITY_DN22123_c0_g1_i1:49-366(+)
MCIRDSINAEYGGCAATTALLPAMHRRAQPCDLCGQMFFPASMGFHRKACLQKQAVLPRPCPYCDMECCLLYTSDAADDLLCVDLGGRRIIKKKKNRAFINNNTM